MISKSRSSIRFQFANCPVQKSLSFLSAKKSPPPFNPGRFHFERAASCPKPRWFAEPAEVQAEGCVSRLPPCIHPLQQENHLHQKGKKANRAPCPRTIQPHSLHSTSGEARFSFLLASTDSRLARLTEPRPNDKATQRNAGHNRLD